MKLARYKACICEGSAEAAIIDILLDNDLLIFTRSEILEGEVIGGRSARSFETRFLRKELIDAAAAYIKLNPSGEWLSSDRRTYFKENGFHYTDSQKKKFLKTVSGGLTDYMSDWREWTKNGRPENVLFLKR